MKKVCLFYVFLCLVVMQVMAQSQSQHAWGDQGNGTYINPVLNADGKPISTINSEFRVDDVGGKEVQRYSPTPETTTNPKAIVTSLVTLSKVLNVSLKYRWFS